MNHKGDKMSFLAVPASVQGFVNAISSAVSVASSVQSLAPAGPSSSLEKKSRLSSCDISQLSADPISTLFALYTFQIHEDGIKAGIYDNIFISTPDVCIDLSYLGGSSAQSIPLPEWTRRMRYKLNHDQLDHLVGIVKAAIFWHPHNDNESLKRLFEGSKLGLEKLQAAYSSKSQSSGFLGHSSGQLLAFEKLSNVISIVEKGIKGDVLTPELELDVNYYVRTRDLWTNEEIIAKFQEINQKMEKIKSLRLLMPNASSSSSYSLSGAVTWVQSTAVSLTDQAFALIDPSSASASSAEASRPSFSAASALKAAPDEEAQGLMSAPQSQANISAQLAMLIASLNTDHQSPQDIAYRKWVLFKKYLNEEFAHFITFEDIRTNCARKHDLLQIESTTADPFSTLLQLGLLLEVGEDAKVHFQDCQLVIDPHTLSSSLSRPREGRNQLRYLNGIISAAVYWYPPSNPLYTEVYRRAVEGLNILHKTYQSGNEDNSIVLSWLAELLKHIKEPESVRVEHLKLPIEYYQQVKSLWSDVNRLKIKHVLEMFKRDSESLEKSIVNRIERVKQIEKLSEKMRLDLEIILEEINKKFQKVLIEAAVNFVSFKAITTKSVDVHVERPIVAPQAMAAESFISVEQA